MRVPDDDLDFDDDQVMHYRGVPFTGVSFDEGATPSEIGYRDGWQHGPARDWHTNGVLRSEGDWCDGRAIGVHRQYDDTGRLLLEETYDGGHLVSTVRHEPDAQPSLTTDP